ncbi:MAG: efflux RND transporter periplasmic adaptor subunit [Rhizobiales bacterium]|nr:efflux RND transporter periplasmic adaptor subunit [Hyphomicrobiales bacterium]
MLVAACAVIAGAGYASMQGRLPALPYGIDVRLKEASETVAGRLGLAPGPSKVAPGEAAASAPAAPPPRPPVAIRTAQAEVRTMPVRLEAIGTVQTLANVIVRARVDSQIMSVEFNDGASVKAGDVLFKLDPRQIDAQIKQAEGNLQRSKATLELNEQDVRRKEQLARNEATSQALLDAARANVATARAQIKSDEAALENLKVQRSFYDVAAPISGRVGVAMLKAGSLTKSGEAGQVLATINQITPIYVAFSIPQRMLPELREAIVAGGARVVATPQGIAKDAVGKIALLDNAVDTATGTIVVRAMFENADELLWPGSLANVRIDLRELPNSVVVPREAVMSGQRGNYVYVVENQVAKFKSVTPGQTVDGMTIISSGLVGGETVVTDGQSQLAEGSKVTMPSRQRPPAAGATSSRGSQG